MAGWVESRWWRLRRALLQLMATSDNTEEISLAQRLVEGDDTALDPFIQIFQAKIFQYSLLMCGHREDAEEVAQDTLLKVFENFSQLREPERVRAWVFRIARNACYMKRRKSVFAPSQELSLDEPGLPSGFDGEPGKLQIADWSPLPDSQLLQSELRRELNRAVASLPDIYRAVFLLRDVEELSTADTAEILGIREEAVKTRLHRARLAIRQKLDDYLKVVQSPAPPQPV